MRADTYARRGGARTESSPSVSVSSLHHMLTLSPALSPLPLPQHVFAVVRSAGSTTYNYKDPVWRDVVTTGEPGDNVTIRFRTDNPGPWFLHCHIDFHLEAGFAIVLAEETDEISSSVTPTSTLSLFASH